MKNSPKNQSKKTKKGSSKKGAKKSSFNLSKLTSFSGFSYGKEFKVVLSLCLILTSLLAVFALTSYLSNWKLDHSLLNLSPGEYFGNKDIKAVNSMGKLGAVFSHLLIYKGFGIASYIFVFLSALAGVKLIYKTKYFPYFKTVLWSLIGIMLTSVFSGFFLDSNILLGGTFGYQSKLWMTSLVGSVGTGTLILFAIISSLIFAFKPNFEVVGQWIENLIPAREEQESEVASKTVTDDGFDIVSERKSDAIDLSVSDEPEENKPKKNQTIEVKLTEELEVSETKVSDVLEGDLLNSSVLDELLSDATPGEGIPINLDSKINPDNIEKTDDSEFVVEVAKEEEVLSDKEVNKLVQEFGEYDPKLDLSNYKSPPVDLLADHGSNKLSVSKDELEKNKDRIVETLANYKIGIAKIKATIGPTVTLYEIVPEKGIRISKIKNLEDDIAMSLSALGIRIIAPIPGKGTVGIEVPNSSPDIVSMKSLIAADKFQNSKMLLPIALGKTIANETYVADLAKMPHLLMAGATGQGKSVGLNAILVSLLYKKHPSQIKFVMVDPKKVELTLFNKIERHYLAKLPDEAEAIITDTDKVVKTLKSLCVEMDERYEMLKKAMVRNLEEYNAKFVARKLNPENGHRYLPYIVLVVDEFADLMMTAGKEVEAPIARLAQLARAIGIHLIIATQRPSVNIITGTIKANFPARIAFRVTSKIDSRTILDTGGADQLIGRGDMLLSTGKELIRLQCGFVDTPEVEEICEFIGSQKAYATAFHLPEMEDESVGGVDSMDDDDRDSLFEDAARIIVIHQQGSASLLQRKLKIGYNRAGRIIDQLEIASIIGPFEGSKARKVLIPDELTLEQYLNKETVKQEI